MRKIYFLALLLVAFFSLHAQKRGQARIDSLLSQLPAMAEDTGKVKLMIDLSNVYADINPAEGIRYGESARELSDKKQYIRGLMDAYNAIGVNYKIKGDFEKSIGYHNRAYAIAEQLADKKTMAGSLGSIGSNYLYQGAYPKALENYLKALKLNEETGNKTGMGSVIGNIGNVYSYLKEYDKSLAYYERAIRIYGELGNKAGVAAYTGNAGYIYLYQNNFPKAIEYISRALEVNESVGNLNAIAGNSQGMGRVYQTQRNYVKAITYYEKALQVAEKVGNKIAIAQNLLTMGEVYLQAAKDTVVSPFSGELSTRKGLLTKALANANRAVALRKEAKDINGLNFAYDTKSDIELQMGDAVAALASYKEHIAYRDSVFNLEKTKEINRRELQYEFGKREDSLKYQQLVTSQQLVQQQLLGKQQQQQLLLVSKEKDLQRLTYLQEQATLQREKEQQASQMEKNTLEAKLAKDISDKQIAQQQLEIRFNQKLSWYLAVGMGLILLIALLIFQNQRRTRKLNTIISKQKSELEELGYVKDRIFSVVSHDMRSPVNTLISFIDILEDADIPADKLRLYAATLKNQLQHTSVLMENLLNWASSQMKGFTPRITAVPVKALVNETMAVLQKQADEKNIRLSNQTGETLVVSADRNMLALVIRNTISNAIKFTPAGGAIEISAMQNNGQVAIRIRDNGTGMPVEKISAFNDPVYLQSLDTQRGTGGESGTGLGLLLCKTFTALMQGNIRVESKEGEGSVFTVVLPAA
ncbi:MAG: tetratricopeptide repeat-containing sensor histidine kinase [Sediminibacterium sp.]|nr:tetratricopeptide repeat-containing sensor histidine kinase [Sediminibacterium sp.]